MSEIAQAPASAEEVAEIIAGLEQYRQRIIDEMLEMAKRVKLPKKQVMAQLENHPEIAKIDAFLENIRSRQGLETSGQ